MARSKKRSTSTVPELNDAFWQRFGISENSGTREKLLYLALSEISRRGILDVNARGLCDLLETDPTAVTYHFGSYDGLIAHVFVTAHDLWATTVAEAVAQPASSPETRLRNVLNAEVSRAERFGPVVGVAHLPHVSEQVEEILSEVHPGAIAQVLSYIMSVKAILIHDLRTGEHTPIDFIPADPAVAEVRYKFPAESLAAVRMVWAIIGPTLWMTGAAGGTKEMSELPPPFEANLVWEGFADQLIWAAKNDPSLA